MALVGLEVRNFRNIRGLKVELSPGINLITGANGAGKTALLEAVYLSARGKSFRATRAKYLVRDGADELIVRSRITSPEGSERTLAISKALNAKSIAKLNGEAARSLSDLAKALPLQVLLPGISDLLLDGPGIRREFLDWGLFHVEQKYLDASRKYRRTLMQRNAWFRSAPSARFDTDPWVSQLIQEGERINAMRESFTSELNAATPALLAQLGCSLDLGIGYAYPGKALGVEGYAKQFEQNFEADQSRRLTHVGPHRGEMSLLVSGRPARQVVSRGQAKLLASSLVLAYAGILSDRAGVAPTLLLDDFGAELDQAHRMAFLLLLRKIGCQVIATSADSAATLVGDEMASSLAVFHVEQGELIHQ